jgi:uncharacterized lipoprotein YbaY
LDGSEPTPVLLRGEIVFDESAASFKGATLYVSLQDTSLADADAVTIAEQVTKDVAYDAGARNTLPFALSGVVPDERAHYTVRVLVDLDGNGQVSHGDFVNVESYPVLTWGHARDVSIRVERVD